ncbi:hypothetical protein [Streptomyces yangpuensis]|nr:hypothetical protein [Streptomyces yangpuensis]
MWTTTGDGTLRFYRGQLSGTHPVDGPSTQVDGSGWNTIITIA